MTRVACSGYLIALTSWPLYSHTMYALYTVTVRKCSHSNESNSQSSRQWRLAQFPHCDSTDFKYRQWRLAQFPHRDSTDFKYRQWRLAQFPHRDSTDFKYLPIFSYYWGLWGPKSTLCHLVSLPVSTPLWIVHRCWSGFPCKWRHINVETFNL